MKKKINKIVTAVPTPESVEQAEITMLSLVKNSAEINEHLAGVQKKIADVLTKDGDTLAALEERQLNLTNALKAFAQANKDNEAVFSPGEKTLKLIAGDIQIHAGQPAIKVLDTFDEATVLIRIKENATADDADADISRFVGLTRTPDPVLDKDAVMRRYNEGTLTPADLTKLGLTHEQKGSILVKPLSLDKLRKDTAKKAEKASKPKAAKK